MQPKQLNIELTAQCTANCIMCPANILERNKYNKDIPFDDALSIIDDAYKLGFKEIHPHLYGEPTLYEKYTDILYKIKEYSDTKIVEYTNGSSLIDPKILKAIIDNVDEIIISIDGATNETMKKTRPGLDPILIKKGIKELYAFRKKTHITIRMTILPQNQHEIPIYKKTWKPYCDDIRIKPNLLRRSYPKLKNKLEKKTRKNPCHRLFDSITITANKNVIICCEDYNEDVILGNLDKESMKDIWLGEKFNNFRNNHMNEEICLNCNYEL